MSGLIVGGARAQYKGVGKVNGTGHYGFLLTAIDGEISGGGGVDRFRIKIWDKDNGDQVIYDNPVSSASCDDTNDGSTPCTAIAGGTATPILPQGH